MKHPTNAFQTFCGLLLLIVAWVNPVEARSPDEIKASGEIKIAISSVDLPPFGFKQAGEPVGIDPDLGKMLATSLGVKPTWVYYTNLPDREKLLMDQAVDVVIGVYSISEKRMESVSFSQPYYKGGSYVMIRSADKNTLQNHTGLRNKRLVTAAGSIHQDIILSFVPGIKSLDYVNEITDSYADLKAGSVDAVVYDKPILDYYVAKHSDFYVIQEALAPDEYGIGLNRGDKALLVYVNNFLDTVRRNGDIERLFTQYSTQETKLPDVTGYTAFTPYTVKPGDSLVKIAFNTYHDPSKWSLIHKANQTLIPVANLIHIGDILQLPTLADSKSAQSSTSCEDKLQKLSAIKMGISPDAYRQREAEIVKECTQ